MNIDIINIGHYRVTSHGGRAHDMFNRQTDKVHSLTALQFKYLNEHRSIEACLYVEALIPKTDNTTI